MAKVEDTAEFQFHKGTIRTPPPFHALQEVPLFQFHKGTIRTNVSGLFVRLLRNFNSIKVRLEQSLGRSEQ